jgi:hypothetical protein
MPSQAYLTQCLNPHSLFLAFWVRWGVHPIVEAPLSEIIRAVVHKDALVQMSSDFVE